MVDSRRGLAEALEKPYERGKTEDHRAKFFEVQAVIEAIDRAITDETRHNGGVIYEPLVKKPSG